VGAPVSVDAVFRALGDATRRAILDQLALGPATTSALAAPHGLTLAAIVQHLQVLESSGLIRSEKTGRVRTCTLEPAGLRQAEQWLASRRARWQERLDRLGALLDEPDEPDHIDTATDAD
jgi:DNA-binding transcriptional ArsR family regulator